MGQLERYGLYVLVVVIFLILGVAIWGDEPTGGPNAEPIAIHDGPGALRAPDERVDPSERLGGFFDDNLGTPEFFVDVPTRGPGQDANGGGLDRDLELRTADVRPSTVDDEDPVIDDPRGDRTPIPVLPPAPAEGSRTYTVVRGDSFARISRKLYGTERYTNEIMELNGATNSGVLRPGQKLRLPDVSTPTESGGDGRGALAAGGRNYTVKQGDSPAWISRQLFGTEAHAQAIMDLNGITDPKRLIPGTVLRVPDVESVPTNPVARTVATNGDTYTVVSGDSPASISRKLFRTEAYAVKLMDANGIADPHRLRVGQVLVVPDVARDGE